jgi:hypothetical protein
MNNAALAGAARSDQFGDTAITTSRISPSVPNAQALIVPDPIEVFRERCEARALLFVHGQMSLHEAVDRLQAAAERGGLIDCIGQDEVQAVMSAAFAAVRKPTGGKAPVAKRTGKDSKALEPQTSERSTPKSVIDAFWLLVGNNDPGRLKAWLRQHPADAPALFKLLEAR